MTDFAAPWKVNDTAVDPRMWTIQNAKNQIVVERLSLNSSKADAEMLQRHIVRCVNRHDALVDAALSAQAWLDVLRIKTSKKSAYLPNLEADVKRLESALKTETDNHATNQQETTST